MLRAAEIAEYRPQRVADHLAPLSEGGFHDFHEQRFVAGEPLDAVAAQADHRALDLGRRIENRLIDRKKILDIVPRLQKHRKDAVLLRAGRFGQPHGDLLLDHADAFRHQIAVLQHLEEYLRRDIVGKIADDLQPSGKQFAQVHLQEVAFHQTRREFGVMRMQVFDAFRVDLGPVGDDVVAPEQKLRQHAHAAPDLQHVAAPGSFRPLPGIRRNIRLYTRHTLRPCLLRNIPPGTRHDTRFRTLHDIWSGTRSDIRPGSNFRRPAIDCDCGIPGCGRCTRLGSVSGPSFRCNDYGRLRLLRSSPSRSLPVRSGKSGNSRSCPQPDLSARK